MRFPLWISNSASNERAGRILRGRESFAVSSHIRVPLEFARWSWVTANNVGIWATFKTWQPNNQQIAAADVTNTGLAIPWPLPALNDIITFVSWHPA
jgi:hypothetical protein